MVDEKKVTKQEIKEWIQVSTGDWFHLDDIRKGLNISNEAYGNLRKAVHDLCAEKICEPRGGRTGQYRKVVADLELVSWLDASGEPIEFNWPKGRDSTGFSFDGDIEVFPRDIIVVSGVSNMGKSAYVLNILVENMDNMKCRLMGNELDAKKFSRRLQRFDWKILTDDEGKPKFESILRYENHKDIILPDGLNIIDWLNLGDNFWRVGKVIEGIQSKLTTGVAVIVLQKSEGKALGRGGDFSRDMASVYFAIDKECLTVVKAKSYKRKNPNGKMYHFTIEDGGSKFMDICEIKKCPKCHGFSVTRGTKCDNCNSTGYKRVEDQEYYSAMPPDAIKLEDEYNEELPF